jgi:hypothetical protein
MKLPDGWKREEPGFYSCHDERLSIVQEPDGRWFLYRWDEGEDAPGTPYATLALALAGAADPT